MRSPALAPSEYSASYRMVEPSEPPAEEGRREVAPEVQGQMAPFGWVVGGGACGGRERLWEMRPTGAAALVEGPGGVPRQANDLAIRQRLAEVGDWRSAVELPGCPVGMHSSSASCVELPDGAATVFKRAEFSCGRYRLGEGR